MKKWVLQQLIIMLLLISNMVYPFLKQKRLHRSEAFFYNLTKAYFLALALFALITACAPARRAAGTRNGEQDT